MVLCFNVRKRNDTSYVFLRTEYYYNPDIHTIGGYTFIDSILVVFENGLGSYILNNFEPSEYQFYTPTDLIDTIQLLKYQDSIPGYEDGRKGMGEYEPVLSVFRIMGKDNLVLDYSSCG